MIKDGTSAPVRDERFSTSFWKREVGKPGLEGLQFCEIKLGAAPLEPEAHWKTLLLLLGLGGLWVPPPRPRLSSKGAPPHQLSLRLSLPS